jgi:multidrug resistance efflux pump
MAEIPVQPKRGVPTWVWVVAVLVILAVLWFILGYRSTPATRTGRAVPAHVAPVAGSGATVATAAA